MSALLLSRTPAVFTIICVSSMGADHFLVNLWTIDWWRKPCEDVVSGAYDAVCRGFLKGFLNLIFSGGKELHLWFKKICQVNRDSPLKKCQGRRRRLWCCGSISIYRTDIARSCTPVGAVALRMISPVATVRRLAVFFGRSRVAIVLSSRALDDVFDTFQTVRRLKIEIVSMCH